MKQWQLALLQVLMFVSGFFTYVVGREYLSILPMVFLAFPAYYGLIKHNAKKGLVFIAMLSVYATLIEATSIVTGFPYGFFTYGEALGSKLYGVVPWAVSFGWVPLVIGAVVIASRFFKDKWKLFLLAVGILVASDLVLDPGAVALGFWTWITKSSYYTIPFVNYLGWLLSSSIGVGLFLWVYKSEKLDTLPLWANLTLVLGNAFWIAVTLFAKIYLATFFGVVLHAVLLWSYYPPTKNARQKTDKTH